MLKGFKNFIMRGNVVDLAVGVVIGVAFTGVVNQFTNSFLQPLIRVFTGSNDPVKAGKFVVGRQDFDWAAFVNSLIYFLLVAAVLYFLAVMPMNRLAERRARGHEPDPPAPSEEVLLLTEIRDALTGAGHAPGRQVAAAAAAAAAVAAADEREEPARSAG